MNKTLPDQVAQGLAEAAYTTAGSAARAYLSRNGVLKAPPELYAALKKHVQQALPSALDDAQAALDCGMTEIAASTFSASMHLAGIHAAQEVTQC